MTPEQFSYWLQGFVELTDGDCPTEEQWKMVCEHLQEVFNKVTPPLSAPKRNGIFDTIPVRDLRYDPNPPSIVKDFKIPDGFIC